MYAPVNVEPSLAFDRNVAVLLETIGSAAAARRHPSGASHLAVAGVTGTQPHVVKAAAAGDRIVGRSPALMRMLGEVDQVAATDATVLLLGETGTGKELVAKALHAASRRSRRAFVRVNCGSLPNGLIESELFGHERGAFTGATAKREGRFALAHGGTLFLDEIGELPLDLQAKLLRVLQEGEFEPLGSSQTRRVDVRVIAATHRDLHEAVRKGDFREDLFYRLHVFPIQLPPLRERKGDIPLLIEAFAAAAAQRMQRRFEPVDAESLRRLQAYAWPGNVRELQNMVERAAISTPLHAFEARTLSAAAGAAAGTLRRQRRRMRTAARVDRGRAAATGARQHRARDACMRLADRRQARCGRAAGHESIDPELAHQGAGYRQTALTLSPVEDANEIADRR